MKTKLLFPAYFKFIGIALLVPGLILGCLYVFFDYVLPCLSYLPKVQRYFYRAGGNLTDEIAATLIIVGCFFIGFSRLKNETRVTQKLRLNALYWAMVVNTIVVLVIAGYAAFMTALNISRPSWVEMPLYYVLYSIFLTLPLFLARYYYLLYAFNRHKLKKQFFLLPYFSLIIVAKTLVVIFGIILGLSLIPSASLDTVAKLVGPVLIILGMPSLLLCVLTKEENETSNNIRLKAVRISYFINYAIFLAVTWLIYDFIYLELLVICSLSLPLIFTFVFYISRKLAVKKSMAIAAKVSEV